MRFLSKALLGMLPVAMLGISAASAATPGWKHTCEGPAVACTSAEPVAVAPKAKVAKAAKAKPANAAADAAAPVKKAKKKVAAKKAQKVVADDQPAKTKKVASKKKSGDGGGSSYQSGIASWYGGYFHGRTTANGEKYNMWSLTAAHKTLPFGTRVKVTNTRNGDSVVVRINDRGPFIAGRVIDLSKAAANEIGMGGLAPVKLTVLGKG